MNFPKQPNSQIIFPFSGCKCNTLQLINKKFLKKKAKNTVKAAILKALKKLRIFLLVKLLICTAGIKKKLEGISMKTLKKLICLFRGSQKISPNARSAKLELSVLRVLKLIF